MSQQRQMILIGADETSQLCSGFIRFIEELFLPIAKQDTKQFQQWTKFKEIIDPFNHKIDLTKVESFLISNKMSKENRPPLHSQSSKRDLQLQQQVNIDKTITLIQEDKISILKGITEKITKQFHTDNTQLDILIKMNDSSLQNKSKFDSASKPYQRRVDYKRRNTDFTPSLKPLQTVS